MKLTKYISPQAFWDIDFNKLDSIKHKDFIILKVFNYGKWTDIVNIIHFYGKNSVKYSLLNAEHMTEQALQIASTIFKISKTNFKCSANKQYRPSLKRN